MRTKSTVLIATAVCFCSMTLVIDAATIDLPGVLSASPGAGLAGNNSGNIDFIAEIPELSPTIGTLVSANISIQFSVSSTADLISPPPVLGGFYIVSYTLLTSTAILPVNGFPTVTLPGTSIMAIPMADPGGQVPALTPATNFAATSGNLPAALVPSLQGNAGFLTVNFSMPVSFLPTEQTVSILDGVATADGSLSVSYTYSPVVPVTMPEPPNATLLLLGGAGAFLFASYKARAK